MLQIMASFIDSNPMEKDRDLRYQHTSEMKTDLYAGETRLSFWPC